MASGTQKITGTGSAEAWFTAIEGAKHGDVSGQSHCQSARKGYGFAYACWVRFSPYHRARAEDGDVFFVAWNWLNGEGA